MKKITVSFQGEYGAFSEKAALSYFRQSCTPVPRPQFRDVFDDVRKRKSSYGIIPIENSLFGSVAQNYDLLLEYPLFIVGELKLRIHHCLMTLPGSSMADVRHIYSHPQALGQCDAFLRKLKNITVHQYYDTAGAAKMIAEEQRTISAAIASEQAAQHYGLKILRKNIETDHRNYTRFLIVAGKKSTPRSQAKTSIIFATKHLPGSLVLCLSAFADRRINLLKIESRPLVGKPWEYIFFADVDSDGRNGEFQMAIRELSRHATFVKTLGSYEIGKVIQ
ncbi:MAG: prephenate dehydratase [Bacteroidota bacterium]